MDDGMMYQFIVTFEDSDERQEAIDQARIEHQVAWKSLCDARDALHDAAMKRWGIDYLRAHAAGVGISVDTDGSAYACMIGAPLKTVLWYEGLSIRLWEMAAEEFHVYMTKYIE